MKILLRGQISDRTPEGRDLLGMTRAFAANGAEVRLAAGIVDPPIPAKLALFLAKEPLTDYDLLISTSPTPASEPATIKLLMTSELFTPSSPWLPGSNSTGWDAVLYGDPDTPATVRAYGDEHLALVPFVPGINVADFPWHERDWWGSLTFMVNKREQDIAKSAFDRLGTYPNPPKLAVVPLESLTSAQIAAASKDFNVLICGSGNRNVHHEFMATGGLVVAAVAGVHTRWLSNDFSYRFIPSKYNEPSENLAITLRDLLSTPEQVYRRADTARQMAQFMDWDRVLDKMFLNLEDVIDGGVALRDKWLRLKPPADVQGNRS